MSSLEQTNLKKYENLHLTSLPHQTQTLQHISEIIYIHTYIIGHYNPSVRNTAQLLTPLMLCALILYLNGGTYSLTSTPNDRLLMAIVFTLRVFARNLLRGSSRRNIFHISFLTTDMGYEPRLLHLISQHTTYQT